MGPRGGFSGWGIGDLSCSKESGWKLSGTAPASGLTEKPVGRGGMMGKDKKVKLEMNECMHE